VTGRGCSTSTPTPKTTGCGHDVPRHTAIAPGLIASLSSIVLALFESPELSVDLVIADGRLLTVTTTVTGEDFGGCSGRSSSATEFAHAPLAQGDVPLQFPTQRLRALEILADLEYALRSFPLAFPEVLGGGP
jgi:hypothetical protein